MITQNSCNYIPISANPQALGSISLDTELIPTESFEDDLSPDPKVSLTIKSKISNRKFKLSKISSNKLDQITEESDLEEQIATNLNSNYFNLSEASLTPISLTLESQRTEISMETLGQEPKVLKAAVQIELILNRTFFSISAPQYDFRSIQLEQNLACPAYARAAQRTVAVQFGKPAQLVLADSENQAGLRLLASGKVDQARSKFEKAIELDPYNPEYRDNLAKAAS